MSAAITCFAPIQGLATSLDTLCAQAYGSGNKHLVGLYCQRMTLFLLCHLVPMAVLWFYSEPILARLVADAETARLAASYLRVLTCAMPGYVLFETGKRFLQAQGLFRATTYMLLVAAPCHVLLVWLLVGRLGFIGAPVAIAVTRTFIPVLFFVWVRFVHGSACRVALSRRAFANWWTMIRLSVPGMVMMEAEYLAFELMIIASSRFGTDHLAAQSILSAIATISFQVPFSVSIASSTRVASLVGAGTVDAAKVAAKVVSLIECFIEYRVRVGVGVGVSSIELADHARPLPPPASPAASTSSSTRRSDSSSPSSSPTTRPSPRWPPRSCRFSAPPPFSRAWP